MKTDECIRLADIVSAHSERYPHECLQAERRAW